MLIAFHIKTKTLGFVTAFGNYQNVFNSVWMILIVFSTFINCEHHNWLHNSSLKNSLAGWLSIAFYKFFTVLCYA